MGTKKVKEKTGEVAVKDILDELKEKSSLIQEARNYESKAKALRREEDAFWDRVSDRCDDVVAFLTDRGLISVSDNHNTGNNEKPNDENLEESDKLEEIYHAYGAKTDEERAGVWAFIMDNRTIKNFQKISIKTKVTQPAAQADGSAGTADGVEGAPLANEDLGPAPKS